LYRFCLGRQRQTKEQNGLAKASAVCEQSQAVPMAWRVIDILAPQRARINLPTAVADLAVKRHACPRHFATKGVAQS